MNLLRETIRRILKESLDADAVQPDELSLYFEMGLWQDAVTLAEDLSIPFSELPWEKLKIDQNARKYRLYSWEPEEVIELALFLYENNMGDGSLWRHVKTIQDHLGRDQEWQQAYGSLQSQIQKRRGRGYEDWSKLIDSVHLALDTK